MIKKVHLFPILILGVLIIISACKKEDSGSGLGGQFINNQWNGPEPFTPEEIVILNEKLEFSGDLPNFDIKHLGHSSGLNLSINPYLATIGRVLFYDKELSFDQTVSCATCHQQSFAFGDNKDFSEGAVGSTPRNPIALGSFTSFAATYASPSTNLEHSFFWDERVTTQTEQISETFQNIKEMGMNILTVKNKVELRPEYQILFKRISKEGTVSEEKIVLALSAFMNALHSQNSFLDQALADQGASSTIEEDIDMFNDSQQLGRVLFNENCMSCHGRSISSLIQIPFTTANNGLDITYSDNGVGVITGEENDNGKFKIPTLRNIEVTGPYMHDGRFETLEEVIDFYSAGIQPHSNLHEDLKDDNDDPEKFNFTEEEKQGLIDFLKTLTDETLLTDSKFSDPFKL